MKDQYRRLAQRMVIFSGADGHMTHLMCSEVRHEDGTVCLCHEDIDSGYHDTITDARNALIAMWCKAQVAKQAEIAANPVINGEKDGETTMPLSFTYNRRVRTVILMVTRNAGAVSVRCGSFSIDDASGDLDAACERLRSILCRQSLATIRELAV